MNHQLFSNWRGYEELQTEDYPELDNALKRLEECFSQRKSDYFRVDGEIAFKIENSVQYTIFLYFLSNELCKAEKTVKADLIYYLNKLMNCVELYCAVELPKHFGLEHPLGTVLGRACYGDYFFAYQGVTFGGNLNKQKLEYPVIGEHVTMYSNSKVLGNAHIGNNVVIAANAYIKDLDIPDNSIVFGQYPNVTVKTDEFEKISYINNHIFISD